MSNGPHTQAWLRPTRVASCLGLALALHGCSAPPSPGGTTPGKPSQPGGATVEQPTAARNTPTATASGGLRFSHIEYRTTQSFVTIGEYLGGKEATGRRWFLRSQAERDGYYMIFLLDHDGAWRGARRAVIDYFRSDSHEPLSAEFALLPNDPAQHGAAATPTSLWLGITGSDWADSAVSMLAWRLRLIDAAGNETATAHSALW
jgi:hypothetical protein